MTCQSPSPGAWACQPPCLGTPSYPASYIVMCLPARRHHHGSATPPIKRCTPDSPSLLRCQGSTTTLAGRPRGMRWKSSSSMRRSVPHSTAHPTQHKVLHIAPGTAHSARRRTQLHTRHRTSRHGTRCCLYCVTLCGLCCYPRCRPVLPALLALLPRAAASRCACSAQRMLSMLSTLHVMLLMSASRLPQEQRFVLRLLAGLLHLGNVQFDAVCCLLALLATHPAAR